MKRLVVGVLLVVLFIPTTASASPWTLPMDDLSLTMALDYARSESEFLESGTKQDFPLDGLFVSNNLRLSTRYGFTDRFEGAASVNFKTVSFASEPLISPAADPTMFADRVEANGAIADFSETRSGVADTLLAARYNILRGLVMFTMEGEAKLPSGYEPPKGTLDPTTGEVVDDVSLGDGNTDISVAGLLGVFVPRTRTFLRLDAGYRLRLGEPGDQIFERFKVGQFLGDHIVLFAGVNGDFTVIDGESIGTTLVAVDPSAPPEAYDNPDEDLIAQDLFLDKDNLSASGGILFVFGRYEISFDYSQTLLGRNQANLQTFSASAAVRLEGVTGR